MTPSTNTAGLRPCEFCRDKESYLAKGGRYAWAKCNNDACCAEGPIADSEAEAITAWNTRASDARIEALEEALKPFAAAGDAALFMGTSITKLGGERLAEHCERARVALQGGR